MKLLFVLALVVVAVAIVQGFPAGPGERAGEAIDNAAAKTRDTINDAGRSVQRGLQNAADKTGAAYDATKDGLKDTARDVKDALNGAPAAADSSSILKLLFMAASCFIVIKASSVFA